MPAQVLMDAYSCSQVRGSLSILTASGFSFQCRLMSVQRMVVKNVITVLTGVGHFNLDVQFNSGDNVEIYY
jgi:hypothetical protein